MRHESEEIPLHDTDEGDMSDGTDSEGDDWYDDSVFRKLPSKSPQPSIPSTSSVQQQEWFPWPNKATFLTHLLLSAPRLRFSRTQQHAILSWARELGANPPTYDTMQRTRAELRHAIGNPTHRECSSSGNVWYLNDIAQSVAEDFANPITRSKMGPLYPEDLQGSIWNAAKLLVDVPDNILTATVRSNGTIYYVDELIQRDHGDLFIAKRWILCAGEHWGLGYRVHRSEQGTLHVATDKMVGVRVSTFKYNVVDILLQNQASPLIFDGERADYQVVCPHPLREKAGQRMVYSVPVIVFIDDVVTLEVALSAEHNTKTTSKAGVLELVSDTQGIVSDDFRN
ncbi:hypothetical protein HETIRDRAFT_319612 [Heterobasidion irregulare TC 32-1]|uniref:Uncharacterized protein n=1 Tax=Heterobasidion irregulare (strain TC 32-1) TaxID=747525 RepID=W4K465_HETIT|nr:uncharacterized protein HETIRDRAFT_319612 [Heterobasidion irregulare TC 32-1]ETW80539.1 hypothetical protein HETIRDRAFT_319612 [Heterobasidion irregulare TC 32-1]